MKRKYTKPHMVQLLVCIEDGIAAGSPASVIVRDTDHLMYEDWETETQYGESIL